MSSKIIKDNAGDEILIKGDFHGVDLTIQSTAQPLQHYRMACFDKAEAREVAEAIVEAAGGYAPSPIRTPTGYLVKRADNAPNSNHYITEPPRYPYASLNKLSNFFADLEAAKKAASEWAAKYKRGYTVWAITEIGTAAPSEPPVSWTDK